MALLLRSSKGAPLSHSEMDANLTWCAPTAGSTQQNLDLKGSLDENNNWTKAQRGPYVALSSASGIVDIDLAESNNFSHALSEDTVLTDPTNAAAGQSGIIFLTQHGSSPKTFGMSSFWYFNATTQQTISAEPGSVAAISYIVAPSGDYAVCSMVGDTA